MIERRRAARMARPPSKRPSLSGPRWTRRLFMVATTAGAGGGPLSGEAMPQMPHMGGSLPSPSPAAGLGRPSGVRARLGAGELRGRRTPAGHLGNGGEENLEVEANRAVGDVLHV